MSRLNNEKGFLLLEVMVSIAVLAGGLVFITRAYSTAKNVVQRSSVMFNSCLLMESRIFEFEEKQRIKEDFKGGNDFSENRDYSWLIDSTPVPRDPAFGQKLNINLVTLEVSRNKDIREKRSYITRYSLITYLNGIKQ